MGVHLIGAQGLVLVGLGGAYRVPGTEPVSLMQGKHVPYLGLQFWKFFIPF